MNLTKLSVENFGKFENFECNLTPGINIIKGANETGKSTLVSAITSLLFSDPKSPIDNVIVSKTWGSEKHTVLKAAITSENFSGTLEKDFDSGLAKLDNLENNVSLDDEKSILNVIVDTIGLSSVELFEATSCIKQGQITNIDGSVEEIKDNLSKLVAGGQEDLAASGIVSKIEQRVYEVTSQDEANPGLLMKNEKEQADLEYNIDRTQREIKNLQTWRNSLAQVSVTYDNVTDDLKLKKAALENAVKVESYQKKLLQIDDVKGKTAEKINNVKHISEKINELNESFKQSVEISKDDLKKIEELESSIKYFRPKQKELESDAETHEKAYSDFKTGPGIYSWLFIFVISLGFAVYDYMMPVIGYYYHIGGIGLLSLMGTLVALTRSNQKKSFLKEQLAQEQQKLDEVKQDIEKMYQELQELLDKYNASSFEDLQRLSWKHSELQNELDTQKQKHKKLLEGFAEEELEIQFNSYENDISEIENEMKNYEIIDISELERSKLIVSQLEEQHNALESEFTTLNRQIEAVEGGSELLHSYLERKELFNEANIKLVEELAVLSLTKECIEKARQNVMISTLELLEKRTSEILSIITDGAYREVKFDKSSLKFEIYSEKKKDWVDSHHELSQETIEQVYLTARLALTEILAGDVTPPIILDDPFNGFDAKRRENTMKLLKEMSANHQILLLTTDDEYDKWADNTVTL